MQVHLPKQNSITASAKNNVSNTSLFLGIVIITLTLTAMFLIPGYSTAFTGLIVIGATVRYLTNAINKKPLLLEITDDKISYLSEEKNELVTINAEEILSINHKFCVLEIHTNDEAVHNINILNTGSEQTRWEIKEHLKRLTEKAHKEQY
jgi:hypothetical protein